MKFILIIREHIFQERTDEELSKIIQLHRNWFVELKQKNMAIDGYGIVGDGKLVEKNNNTVEVNPLRDVHEGVGGFYIIECESLEMAIEIAKDCPTFEFGDKIEVRPLM